MGIYDRDYYRRERPYLSGTFMRVGQTTKWLIIANVVFYVIQLLTGGPGGRELGPFTNALVMDPDKVFSSFPQVWRLLTGAFLHAPGDFMHILWNMLFLFFFGPDMENIYGPKEFLAFYLSAGVLGNLFWGLTALWQTLPGQHLPIALGASGAVMAVTILCALHYPHRTILIMFVLPVPLWLWAVILVAGDLYYFLGAGHNTTVAVAAHLGGAGFGFLYYKLQWRLLRTWTSFTSLMRRPSQPRLRVYKGDEPMPARTIPIRPRNEQLEAKADAILAKVSREGMDSLTPEEREVLQQVSEEYKKRRT